MTSAAVLLLALRLPCWPFEVEGQGDALAEGQPVEGSRPGEPARGSANAAPPPPLPRPPLPVPLIAREQARYEIRYGIFGQVGEIRLSLRGPGTGAAESDGATAPAVRAEGEGEGAILGIGRVRRRIETEFDGNALTSRRWKLARSRGGELIVDVAERDDRGGMLKVTRSRSGGAPTAQPPVSFPQPTSDAVGTLLRLRAAPPKLGERTTMHALDGSALWRIDARTVSQSDAVPDSGVAGLRLDGEVTPVTPDGTSRDPERPVRRFRLWLSADAAHVPLRLEVPIGLGDVVIVLAELQRDAPATAAARKPTLSPTPSPIGAPLRPGEPSSPSPRRPAEAPTAIPTEIPTGSGAPSPPSYAEELPGARIL